MNIREAHREVWSRKLVDTMQPPNMQAPPSRVAWTLELLDEGKGDVLVDVGAGSGSLMAQARGKGYRVFGIDFDEPLVKWLSAEGYAVECVDASSDQFPFEDMSVGVVTFCDVIEHLMDPGHALAEIRRILRPGGLLIAGTANYTHWKRVLDLVAGSHRPTSDDKVLLDGGHVSYWGAADLKDFLEAKKFIDVKVLFRNVHICPDDVASYFMTWARDREWLDYCYQIAIARRPAR